MWYDCLDKDGDLNTEVEIDKLPPPSTIEVNGVLYHYSAQGDCYKEA